jgi:arabinogalactan endo-1,4-beta-galactosidase
VGRTYHKDIVVVATAYPYTNAEWWTRQKNMAWPISKQGRRAFLQALVETVARTPDGRGKGVIWWYPEAIPVKGLKIWNGGATALFDAGGNVLPAAGAFRPRPKPGEARSAAPASPS